MARSRNIGGVHATLSLKDQGFAAGLKKARAAINNYGAMALKFGAAAGTAVAAGLIAGTKHAITMGAELDHLSTQSGVAASTLMRLGQAYKDSGKDASGLGKDIAKMQKAIFTQATEPGVIDYFAEIGLSAKELMAMSPESQFFKIAAAIKSIQDPTKKAAAAMGIFGKSGAQLITVFDRTTLADVNASLGRMPEIMDMFSGALERADTLMGRLPNKSDQFFTGFTAGVIGEILPALESVNAKDFTTLGENLGDAIATGLNMITSGDIWEIFALEAQKAIAGIQTSPAMNGFAAGINALIDGFQDPGGMGYSFSDSFKKYSEAGIAANTELTDDLQAKIDAIASGNKRRQQERKSKAATYTIPIDVMSPPPSEGFTMEIPDWLKRNPYANYGDSQKTQSRNWETSQYNVNDYQSRGLSLDGGMQRMRTEEKKVGLLTSIRDILKKAETDGELVWRT